MAGSLIILLFLPFIYNSKIKGAVFSPTYKILFWIFISNAIFLGWIGGKVTEPPYQFLGVVATLFYFVYFILLALF
jgi:ubiquinol-cytochrome c reductase cytochrome b subunit